MGDNKTIRSQNETGGDYPVCYLSTFSKRLIFVWETHPYCPDDELCFCRQAWHQENGYMEGTRTRHLSLGFMTVDEAKMKCDQLLRCEGFSHAGPPTDAAMMMHFVDTSNAILLQSDVEWTSFLRGPEVTEDEIIEIPIETVLHYAMFALRLFPTLANMNAWARLNLFLLYLLIFLIMMAKIAALVLMAMVKMKTGNNSRFRKVGLFISLLIFVLACFSKCVPFAFLTYDLLMASGCYVKGSPEMSSVQTNHWAYRGFHTSRNITCFTLYWLEQAMQVATLIVGARLVVISRSIGDMILNATAAVFVLELGEFAYNFVFSLRMNRKHSSLVLKFGIKDSSSVFKLDEKIVVSDILIAFLPPLVACIFMRIREWKGVDGDSASDEDDNDEESLSTNLLGEADN